MDYLFENEFVEIVCFVGFVCHRMTVCLFVLAVCAFRQASKQTHTHKLVEHDIVNYAVQNKLMRENGIDHIKIKKEISGPNHQWVTHTHVGSASHTHNSVSKLYIFMHQCGPVRWIAL